jgi:fusion and transport protein UGO1
MATDILTASSPLVTLLLSFISSSVSALVLSPIDTARTFLMLTPATHGPRSLVRGIRQLPTPNCTIPPHLVPITILHSSLPNLIMTSTPLFLKSYLSIDPLLNPSMWNLFTFLSSGLELAVRFPLETVLRRAQIATYTSLSLRQKSSGGSIRAASIDASDVETIVPTPRTYRGVVGTMWHIVHEEGVSPNPSDSDRLSQVVGKSAAQRQTKKRQQGQGIQGLYRGWRVGMWGIAGIWGAGLLGGIAGAGEEEVTMRGGHGRSSGGQF